MPRSSSARTSPSGTPRGRELGDVAAVLLHLLEQRDELRARRRRAGHLGGQRAVVPDAGEQELRHLLLVLQVRLLLPLRDLEERRLGDVEEALLDDGQHVPEEEGQEQRADVRAVDVGVGHDDDLVVAELSRSRSPAPMPVPSAVISVADLRRGEHLVEPRLLDVQDLAAQRQDRLEPAVAALLGRAAGRVPFDDEDLGEGRVLLLAVGELARKRPGVERALAPHELARLARRLARARRLDDLLDDLAADARVLLEVRAELLVDDLLDPRLDLGGDELVLGLRGELRIAHLDGDDGRQSLAAVVAREARLLERLGQRVRVGVFLDRPRQRGLEALQVRAAVAVVDRVREGEERLGVALVPLERDFDALLVGVALGVSRAALDVLEIDDLVVDRRLGLVQVLDEGSMPPS